MVDTARANFEYGRLAETYIGKSDIVGVLRSFLFDELGWPIRYAA